jgi:YHS domain-containing protein
MIDRFPSSQKLQKDHTKAIDITLLCQLASHSISVPNSAKIREVVRTAASRYFNSSCKGQKYYFCSNTVTETLCWLNIYYIVTQSTLYQHEIRKRSTNVECSQYKIIKYQSTAKGKRMSPVAGDLRYSLTLLRRLYLKETASRGLDLVGAGTTPARQVSTQQG